MKLLTTSLLIALLTPALSLSAEEPLQLFTFGNSLTANVGPQKFEEVAAAGGHPVHWDRLGAPGVPIWNWSRSMDKWQEKFNEKKWDVVTVQPFSSFEKEMEAALQMAEHMAENQPQAQFYVYAQWPGRQSANWFTDFSAHQELPAWSDRSKIPDRFLLENVVAMLRENGVEVSEDRALKNEYELMTLALRQWVPMEKPVKMIPAGHVMELLGQKMQAGEVPGMKTPHDFYGDNVHLNNIGAYSAAMTWYATLFGESPVGLPVGPYQGSEGVTAKGALDISDELAKVIQQTAWEVVATHPLTGVTSDEPVKIATPALPAGVVGEPYRARLQPAFGQGPYQWAAANLPKGLELTQNGILQGTPEAAGQSALALTVKDAKGGTAERGISLVIEEDTAPQITTTADLGARPVGEYFALNLETEGGNGAIDWRLPRGKKMPGGLLLDKSGRISGALGVEGRQEFTLIARDSDSAEPEEVEQTFFITGTPPAEGTLMVRNIPKDQEPNIDGVIEDSEMWNLNLTAEKVVEGTSNNQVTWDIAWSSEAGRLYIAVRVVDDAIETTREDMTQGDAIDFFFDTLNNRELVYNFDDKRFTCVIEDGRARNEKVGMGSLHKAMVTKTDDGYVVEFYTNLLSPAGLVMDRGVPEPYVIGFDLAIYDDDNADGKRDSMTVWKGTADNATVPNQFGTLILQSNEN